MAGNPDDPVLTLEDLASWSFRGTPLAVLGHPIAHSLSPPMHNAALAAMAVTRPEFSSWKYFRFDVPPDRLAEALGRLHAADFQGVNLTVPHKVLACGLVADVDPAAAPIGALNTLRRTPAGWRGFNTDGHGLATALQHELGVGLRGASVVLLGAGGAARGAAVECLARGCAALWIGNRTRSNLDALLAVLAPLAGPIPIRGFDPARPPPDLPADAVVVNATSAGLKPDEPAPIALRRLPAGISVFDMIYNPPQTALLRDAAALGLRHANGLAMLVHQGVRALELWTGATVPADVMARAARAALPPA
ncbi:MAG TPA: shikimate dehydrogenase [Opitutaceae bacterium]|nr:shikimate dehydrogenase [Opitutaceae bacterium]